jgi:hypothetical protein
MWRPTGVQHFKRCNKRGCQPARAGETNNTAILGRLAARVVQLAAGNTGVEGLVLILGFAMPSPPLPRSTELWLAHFAPPIQACHSSSVQQQICKEAPPPE